MSKKNGRTVKCAYCGKEAYKKQYELLKSDIHFCSKTCSNNYNAEIHYKKIEETMNINLEDYLFQKYIVEKWSMHKIQMELGISNKTVPKLLKKYNLKQRALSESIKLDWENNDEKRATVRHLALTKFQTKENRDKLRKIMQTDEYKNKISKANKGSNNGMYHKFGSLNPAYNPELLLEDRIPERKIKGYKSWRNGVYERDNYTCQCCGYDKGHILVAHHLNSYHWDRKNRTIIDNGITLCEKCHKEFHKKYGNKNNTKEQFEEFNKKVKLAPAI